MKKLFILALLIVFAGAAHADQMVRYTDSNGKVNYVETIDQVPEEYRPSASIVRIRSRDTAPPAETSRPETFAEPEQVSNATADIPQNSGTQKNALKFTKAMKLVPTPDSKASFTGSVKNVTNESVKGAKVSLDITRLAGEKSKVVSKKIVGKGESGVIGAGETVKVNITTNIPMRKVTGFYSRLSWATTVATSIPAEKQPSK